MPEIISDGARLSVGFVFSSDGESVLLIKKKRPKFLAGLLNGTGGHADGDETPVQTVSRETDEETALFIPVSEWVFLFDETFGNGVELSYFAAVSDHLDRARQTTDETIHTLPVSSLSADKMAPGCIEALILAREKLGFSALSFAPASVEPAQAVVRPLSPRR